MKKRSDFEHKINGRGSQPSDYARYAEYEINLESLRWKRSRRMRIKAGAHIGQRRIFFVLDRATRKFQGDLGLWMQYVDYAKRRKAYKKLSQILTSVLRMHPTKPELWIYAANYSMDTQGDVTEARSYMQRGLRFCKSSRQLWLEYAKLEMMYIAKIATRKSILGLDLERASEDRATRLEKVDADHIALPIVTAEDIDPSLRSGRSFIEGARKNISVTPALCGAIPIAIYDTATEYFADEVLNERFFELFAGFRAIPCQAMILRHVVETLSAMAPGSPEALSCYIREPSVGTEPTAPDFPLVLGITLDRLRSSLNAVSSVETKKHPWPRLSLLQKSTDWLLTYLDAEKLDPDLRIVLVSTLKKLSVRYMEKVQEKDGNNSEEVANMLDKFYHKDLQKLVEPLVLWATKTWPSNTRLLEFGGVAKSFPNDQ